MTENPVYDRLVEDWTLANLATQPRAHRAPSPGRSDPWPTWLVPVIPVVVLVLLALILASL